MSFDAVVSPDGAVVVPGAGERIWQLGNIFTVKAGASTTRGAYTLLEQECAGAPPPRHVHEHEEEAFYVLDGTLDLYLGDDVVEVHPGSFCLVPRGTVHTFRSTSVTPARVLVVLSPPGFERFFVACEQRFPEIGGMPDPAEAGAALTAMAPEHGLRVVGPPPPPRSETTPAV